MTGLVLLGAVAAYQGVVLVKEWGERVAAYSLARQVADQQGKPLLNVGCPSTNQMRHPCGDVCLDVDPTRLEACTAVVPMQGSVCTIPYPDRSFGAATCFHILEHLPTVADAEQATRELERVADYVFVLSPSRQNILSWFHPDHLLWPIHQEDGSIVFEDRRRGPAFGESAYPVFQTVWGTWDALIRARRAGRPVGDYLSASRQMGLPR